MVVIDEDMEATSCDELRLMYPFKDWEKLNKEQIFGELQRDADNVCEAFNNLVTEIFKSFRDHSVDLESLKVYTNTFCSTMLPKANLESLRACKTMAEVFCFIGEHSLWLCPTLLEAIVKKFGNESDQEKLREYQDHSLEPYLRKSILDIRCQLVMIPTCTINQYVMENIQSDASLSKVIGWDSKTASFMYIK